ncbi:MAG: FtsX-like permease family protein [Planctomycetes bacterium]|nr:FtsX-like permease family protein [Planctomycetota bacterium]
MSYLSFFLCLKYLRRRKIVFLSIAAVAMSCALLITVASLFTGFINAVENGVGEHMGDIVIAAPSGTKISGYDKLIDDLAAHPLIDGATAVLESQGLLHLPNGNVRAVRIWGIELPRRTQVSPVEEFLINPTPEGRSPSFALDTDGGELGGFVGIGVVAKPDDRTDEYDIAGVRSEFLGHKVTLTTGTVVDTASISAGAESASSGARFKRKTLKFSIANVVYSGMYEFDRNFVFLPISMLSEKLYPDRGNVAGMIQIRLSEAGQDKPIDEVVKEVEENVWLPFAKGRFNWARYAKVESSKKMQARLIAEYKKQMAMLMLIFGVVSGGVVILIFCIFYLIVMTKQKDIAIVKSCGLGSGAVATMFVLFGFAVGAAGSALGVGLGCLVTKNVNTVEQWISMALGLKIWKSSTYMFSRIPNEVDWTSVVWIVAAAVVAAGVGALIPAIAAARLKPVEILRYE